MQTTRTISHDEIRDWAETHGASPAIVASSRVGERAMLRLDFGEGVENLERVSWDDFFDIFEENDLAFAYDSEEAGDASLRYHFVARTADDELGSYDEEEASGITEIEEM